MDVDKPFNSDAVQPARRGFVDSETAAEPHTADGVTVAGDPFRWAAVGPCVGSETAVGPRIVSGSDPCAETACESLTDLETVPDQLADIQIVVPSVTSIDCELNHALTAAVSDPEPDPDVDSSLVDTVALLLASGVHLLCVVDLIFLESVAELFADSESDIRPYIGSGSDGIRTIGSEIYIEPGVDPRSESTAPSLVVDSPVTSQTTALPLVPDSPPKSYSTAPPLVLVSFMTSQLMAPPFVLESPTTSQSMAAPLGLNSVSRQ